MGQRERERDRDSEGRSGERGGGGEVFLLDRR